ncbi:MAG: 30S ribosomal protein S20 [Pseudomonadota bacterium]
MANTTSAKKAVRQIARRTEVNKSRRSEIRSEIRRVEAAIAAGDREAAVAAFRTAEPLIVRGGQKGIVHARAASRKVSRLAQRIKGMEQTA